MPLCIDLFCGLGGWTEGFLAEGYEVIGFDVEQHVYGEHRYPAQLVLQDVCTLQGSQFKNAAVIVASSPCQAYSYMAMPWTRAKDQAKWYRDPACPERLVALNLLFSQPRRIQLEACEAAGRYIPMIQENVRGAQPWVGRSTWNFGSYHLWGDVPALMPITHKGVKVTTMGAGWYPPGHPKHVPGLAFNTHAERRPSDGVKVGGGPGYDSLKVGFQASAHKRISEAWRSKSFATAEAQGIKQAGLSGPRDNGKGDRWFQDGAAKSGSKSSARKAASARIAKIPFPLSQHIARACKP